MDFSFIIPEDGTSSTSYENIFKMSFTHGPVVAVTHIITPQKDHVTKIFFLDGKTHTAMGLALGHLNEKIKENPEFYAKCIGLLMVIQSIWGMACSFDGSQIWKLGFGEEVEKTFKENKNAVYHFFPNDKTNLSLAKESDGMIAFEQSSEFIEEDKNDIRIINND